VFPKPSPETPIIFENLSEWDRFKAKYNKCFKYGSSYIISEEICLLHMSLKVKSKALVCFLSHQNYNSM